MLNPNTLVTLGPLPDALSIALQDRFHLQPLEEITESQAFEVAVTTSMLGLSEGAMRLLPRLRLVLCNGAGLDRIDLAAAERRGIEIYHTPDAVTQDTADFAIALLYAAKRRLAQGDRFVRSGAWSNQRNAPTRRVTGSRVGILGLGRIGSLVASRCEALGTQVAYHTPRRKTDAPYRYVDSLLELANWSDTLILCCPATPQTQGLVDQAVLAKLGAQGTLINVSRGSVVNEEDLIVALQGGLLGFAALDVFASEPEVDPRLLRLDNVLLSPHAAAVTLETRADMAELLRCRAEAYFAERARPRS